MPGLKLKKVDGQPIAGLNFKEALELVKAASRPVTLSFIDTELPTVGATLGNCAPFEQYMHKRDHFAKTGSGQT